jgi:hypothetical protein
MAATNRRLSRLLCLIFLTQFILLRAEIPPLEREINITIKNEDVKSVLTRIEKQASVFFSYNPSIISGLNPVTATLVKKTVREVLFTIFKDKLTFQTRSNYIILKEKSTAQQSKKTKVSGYVYDESSGIKLSNVTIYDPATLRSTTSDEYGYYEISVPAPAATLAINKAEYRDTTLVMDTTRNKPLNNIAISTVTAGSDTTEWNKKIKELNEATSVFFKRLKSYVHTVNVRDTITRDVQVSFLPFIGTNHKMSGNVYNRLSFNILGGYSRGNTGFEAGGLFNVNRENMKGVQVAGLFNIVGDSVKGVQGAGLMNINRSNEGVQVAGLINVTSYMRGFTGAGLMNITGSLTGMSAAGLANISGNTNGFAVAGLFNADAKGKSRQVAGLFNVASETELQVAGLFNTAGYVRGVQISTFNFADSASGVPLGFMSLVRTGVHQLEFSADEWFYANAAFRTGVHAFYNIFSAGLVPGNDPLTWQVGYGIGTSVRISNNLRWEMNLSDHHVSRGAFQTEANELLRLYPAIECRFGKNLCLAGGPTFNLYLTNDALNESGPGYSRNMPYNSSDGGDFYYRAWIGGKLSLRFF